MLLDASEEHFPDWHPFVLCAVRAGLRLGELRALEWGDFDWRQRFIRVERNWVEGKLTTPKNGKARNVDMSLQLRAILRLWRRRLRIEWFGWGLPMPQLVFPSEEGTPLDDANLRKVMVAIVEKAQVRRHRSIVHVMRHSFASLLLQQGESLMYVKEQMGHSSIQITADVYGHLIPGGNRAAVDRLDDSHARVARTLQGASQEALRRPA
jgi:integrase